jgi:hypothetical protein
VSKCIRDEDDCVVNRSGEQRGREFVSCEKYVFLLCMVLYRAGCPYYFE